MRLSISRDLILFNLELSTLKIPLRNSELPLCEDVQVAVKLILRSMISTSVLKRLDTFSIQHIYRMFVYLGLFLHIYVLLGKCIAT